MTTLVAATGLGTEFGRHWPIPPAGWTANVMLVCRATAAGTWAAVGAAEQYASGARPPNANLLGLVVVAAGPRKPPRAVAERIQLLSGWVPAVHRVGWVESYLAVDNPRDVGDPPDVAALRQRLVSSLTAQPQSFFLEEQFR